MFTRNKKIMTILAIIVVGALFGSILFVSALNGANSVNKTGSTVTEWVSSQETVKATENENVPMESNASFYDLAYAKATSEQKEELDKIVADKSLGLPGEWRRPVLIVMGDLPKDMPRLSVEQATKLFDTKEIGTLESEFNKIAGAPDFIGGSGIERSIYFLNNDKSEAIILMIGDVFYVINNDDGTQTRLPLGTQKLSADPSSTANI